MTMTSRNLVQETPVGNQLLAVLSTSVMHELRADFKYVTLRRGDVLYDVGDSIDNLFFPSTGLLAITVPMADRSAVPVITIGSEGMIGLSAILGATRSLSRVTVAGGGSSVQVSLRALPRLAQHESV
jgi:CRP-like cAMP-binding protein